MEIKELHKIIDPDALEDLTSSNSSVRVKFRYEGHEVIVQEGDVTLQE
ncbi:HalOD1 output domain-containing protein [Halobellus marinus]